MDGHGSSYPHDGVPGGSASEPYARNMDDYRCVTTAQNPRPSTPFQSTTAETSTNRTGEGYLCLSGESQKENDTTDPAGSPHGTYSASSGEPARSDANGYKSYTLANTFQEIPAEETLVTQVSPSSAPPAQEMPPAPSLPPAISPASIVQLMAPSLAALPAPASLPEAMPDPRTTVFECLQDPPLRFKCPLGGCDAELAARKDGLSLHISNCHQNLLKSGWKVDCPVPGCTVATNWAKFYLHLLYHLKKLRGDYVWCRDCDVVLKAKSAPSHLATPRHKNGGPSRSTSKGGASRKVAPKNPSGKSKPRAKQLRIAPTPSGPPGSVRWA